MSNKTQLQTNNTNLQTVLSNVLGLPTEESCKNGAYVWKRKKATSYSVANPVVAIPGELSTGSPVTSSDVDLDTLTDEFFDGFSYMTASEYYFLYENGQLYYVASGTKKEAYYDRTAHTLTIPSTSGSFAGDAKFQYTGTKNWTLIEDSGFTVSDQSTAYPDGGMQGEYYYEKVNEGIDLLSLTGYSKIAINKFTFSSNASYNSKISHSLNQIPKRAMLFSKSTDEYIESFDAVQYSLASDGTSGYLNGQAWKGKTSDGLQIRIYTSDLTFIATNSTIKLDSASNVNYQSGVEYILITMA